MLGGITYLGEVARLVLEHGLGRVGGRQPAEQGLGRTQQRDTYLRHHRRHWNRSGQVRPGQRRGNVLIVVVNSQASLDTRHQWRTQDLSKVQGLH